MDSHQLEQKHCIESFNDVLLYHQGRCCALGGTDLWQYTKTALEYLQQVLEHRADGIM